MPELPSPLAVVCHDAGAANIILAWLKRSPPAHIRPVMQGPAERLWQEAFPQIPCVASLSEALAGSVMLLSGTGWASSLEHDARMQALARGIRSAAVLDHWVNFGERFVRGGEPVWPNEFWVTDSYALAEARRCFPGQVVAQHANLYLQAEVDEALLAGTHGHADEVLYVLEPARSDWGRGEPGEFQALNYFVDNMPALGLSPAARVHLRPHPSDPPKKYESWMRGHPQVNCLLDRSSSLGQALAGPGWVAGCESFALVVALAAGRQVVCSLPPWAPPCRLPHEGLIHLKDRAAPQP